MGIIITLRNDWSKLADALVAKAPKVLDQAAQQAFDESQNLVAVDTGELKASGYIDPVDDTTRDVVYGTDHAWFVEFGTRKMGAQPYLVPAMNHLADQWPDLVGSLLNGDEGDE